MRKLIALASAAILGMLLVGVGKFITSCSLSVTKLKSENIPTSNSAATTNTESAQPLNPEPSLVQQNTTLGNIHIGDTQETVKSIYGTPTKITQAHGTPFVEWDYLNQDLIVFFFRKSESAPAGGVVQVNISQNSKLQTNTNIGILSTSTDIKKAYKNIYRQMDTGDVSNIVVAGPNHDPEVGYYPTLTFVLKKSQVILITLSNNEKEPMANNTALTHPPDTIPYTQDNLNDIRTKAIEFGLKEVYIPKVGVATDYPVMPKVQPYGNFKVLWLGYPHFSVIESPLEIPPLSPVIRTELIQLKHGTAEWRYAESGSIDLYLSINGTHVAIVSAKGFEEYFPYIAESLEKME